MSARLLLPIEVSANYGRIEYLFPNSGLIIANGEGLNIFQEESRELTLGYSPLDAYDDAPSWANAIASGKEKGRIHFLQIEQGLVNKFQVHISPFWSSFIKERRERILPPPAPDLDYEDSHLS